MSSMRPGDVCARVLRLVDGKHPLRTRLLPPISLGTWERLRATTIRQVDVRHRQGADIAPDITPAEVLSRQATSSCLPARRVRPPPRTSAGAAAGPSDHWAGQDVPSHAMFSDVRLGRPLDLPAPGLLVDEMAESITQPHALISLARPRPPGQLLLICTAFAGAR